MPNLICLNQGLNLEKFIVVVVKSQKTKKKKENKIPDILYGIAVF